MSIGVFHVLVLSVCVYLSSAKVKEVKPRWIYNDNDNRKPLPDLIQIDLELQSGKITLNLVKRLTEPIEAPLIITKAEGQSSIWKKSEEEFLGTYKDAALDASATVTVKSGNRVKEILYMITMTHNDKAVFLEPCDISEAYKSFDHSDLVGVVGDNKYVHKDDTINNKSKLVSIGGVFHSLHETTIKVKHNLSLEEDRINGTVKEKNFVKRSFRSHLLKQLATVRIFTIIDDSVFNKFFELSKAHSEIGKKEEARRTVRYIFTHIMQGLKDIYEGIENEKVRFTTEWAGALIAESASDVPFVENSIINGMINNSLMLKNMKDWVHNEQKDEYWPQYDFIVTFTSRFMNLLGFANIDGICTSLGIGVVKYATIFQTTTTLAHELGHSLNATHDGEFNNCNPEDFIMTERRTNFVSDDFNKPYLFSKCSIERMVNKVNSLKFCSLLGKGDFSLGRERNVFLSLLPGQIYDPDDQCRIVFGSKSYHLGGVNSGDKICGAISCHMGGRLKAMDGTPCSNGAWCRNGRCVPDSKAPRTPENCIYGDYKNLVYSGFTNGKLCKNEIKTNPLLCLYAKEECCLSCATNGTIHSSCEDIKDECSKIVPRDCYYDYYAAACCKTCRTLVQSPSDPNCLYGDKGNNCSNLVPEICQLSSRFCCQTCAAFASTTSATFNHSASPVTSTVFSTITSEFATTDKNVSFTPKLSTSFSTRVTTRSMTDPTNSLPTNSCIHGDYINTLEYSSVWGIKTILSCEQLVKYDSSLCYNDDARKYCCASCINVQIPKDYCRNGDDNDILVYLSKNFTCSQLVKYNPRLCESNRIAKNKCCKSCGRFTIRPLKV